MNLTDLCRTEIVRLHEFFEAWFNGTIADSDESYESFEGALDEGFQIVSTSGTVTGRADLLAALRPLHGRDHSSPMKIWIENVAARSTGERQVLVTYEEWQTRGSETRGRISTALLRHTEGSPLQWLHVHETWLPG